MGTSHRTKPRLERLSVAADGSYYSDPQQGQYARWQDAQWVVERQHGEILRLRTELSKYKARSEKRFKKIAQLQKIVEKEGLLK